MSLQGTDPRNGKDVAVDYAYDFQKAEATQLFGSNVSIGVYNGLFGTFSQELDDQPIGKFHSYPKRFSSSALTYLKLQVYISTLLDTKVVPDLVGAVNDVMTHVTVSIPNKLSQVMTVYYFLTAN